MKSQARLKKHNENAPGASVWDRITKFPYPYLILFLAIFIIYGQVLRFSLGKLDEFLILSNLDFISDFANLKAAFLKDALLSDKGCEFYRPLQNISFMVDAHISGAASWGYYLTNLLLHSMASGLLYYLLCMFSPNRKLAIVLSLFFAVNPLFVQSLAWVPSRGDLLMGVFCLLSFIFFVRYLKERKFYQGLIHVSGLLLAVFSKEPAVLLPLVCIAYYLFVYRDKKISIVPVLIFLVSYLFIIWIYLYFRALVVKVPVTRETFGFFPLIHNLQTIPEYISKFFLPAGLSPMPGFSLLISISGLVMIGLLCWLCFKFRPENQRMIIFAVFWFLVFAGPGLLYARKSGATTYDYLEHRSYLPLMGIVMLVFWLFNHLEVAARKKFIPVVCLAAAFVYGAYSLVYAGEYKTPLQYYELAVKTNPNSALAVLCRGLSKYYDTKDPEAAIADYDLAIKLQPDYAEAYLNKGLCERDLNNAPEALACYEKAASLKPELFQAHFNIANMRSDQGNYQGALKEYNLAMNLYPTFYQGYNIRGILKYQMNDPAGAIADFDLALKYNPKYGEAYLNKGRTFFSMNDLQKACANWKLAAEYGSGDALTLMSEHCH